MSSSKQPNAYATELLGVHPLFGGSTVALNAVIGFEREWLSWTERLMQRK
jgi:hypothetical protein